MAQRPRRLLPVVAGEDVAVRKDGDPLDPGARARPDAAQRSPGGSAAAPSVDVARRRLGGRATPSTALAGRIVALLRPSANDPPGALRAIGVALYATDTEVDVWIDQGIVRRVTPDAVETFDGPVSAELGNIAADAAAFAQIREGERVDYADAAGNKLEGDLVEKCRYGGLVLRGDGRLIAVGFRKLWSRVRRVAAPN